jgi:TPR repeat protein
MPRGRIGRSAYRAALFGLVGALGLAGDALVSRACAADTPPPAPDAALQAALADYAQGDWDSAWFRLWALARQGNAAAQFDLAQLYRSGKGIPADLHQAFAWYEKAAAQGHGYAQYNLGVMYELGQGTPRNLTQARTWYARAAAQNIAGSQAALRRLEGGGPASSAGRASP